MDGKRQRDKERKMKNNIIWVTNKEIRIAIDKKQGCENKIKELMSERAVVGHQKRILNKRTKEIGIEIRQLIKWKKNFNAVISGEKKLKWREIE